MDGIRMNCPGAANLSGKASGFDCRIRVGPVLRLLERACFHDKDAAKRAIIHERPGDDQLLFFIQLTDVGHVRILKFVTFFFAQLRRIGRTSEKDKKILRLGILRS